MYNIVKKTNIALVVVALLLSMTFIFGSAVSAQSPDAIEQAAQACRDRGDTWDGSTGTCNETSTGTPQSQYYKQADCQAEPPLTSDNCGIVAYLVIIINVLSVLAGIAITASIIIGGIQYSMAGNDPQKVSAAKTRIRNAIFALVFFLFGYALLDNFLIPGGLM